MVAAMAAEMERDLIRERTRDDSPRPTPPADEAVVPQPSTPTPSPSPSPAAPAAHPSQSSPATLGTRRSTTLYRALGEPHQ